MNQVADLERAIANVEAQRRVLGDAVADLVLEPLRRSLAELTSRAVEPTLPAERKLVTILFADISGFTALSERLDPEAVREIVNGCFDVLVPIVERYGGRVDKFIGDEIMALFGAPVTGENDAEMAVRTALSMQDALHHFNAERGLSLSLHIGMNTGRVVAGEIGSTARSEYSVMGAAVNLASRLCNAGEAGDILAASETHGLTRHLFHFDELEPRTFAGIETPVGVYRVIRARATTAERAVRSSSILAGRDVELGRLAARVHDLRGGLGGRAVITGEAGIGKSRLVTEALTAHTAGATVVRARGLAHMMTVSDWAVRELLRALLRCEPNAQPADIAERLEATLPPDAADREMLHAPLAWLAGATLTERDRQELASLGPELRRRRVHSAFWQLVRLKARLSPVVLLCEDLHWWDLASLDILGGLDAVEDCPVLTVMTARPMQTDAPTALQTLLDGADTIRLLPLDLAASGMVIDEILTGIDPVVRSSILERADGNPFFLEEIANAIAESGEIVVPATVEGLIGARIDRLPTTDKALLQSASVIGRTFIESVLQQIFRAPVDGAVLRDVATRLQELCRRDLIRHAAVPVSADDGEFIFRHALMHEVTYGTLLLSRRRELHARIGAVLEDAFADRIAEIAPQLAFHYGRADAPGKALRFLLLAGDGAAETYANDQAAEFYQSALSLADSRDDAESSLAALIGLAAIFTRTGRGAQARALYARALAMPALPRTVRARLNRLNATTCEQQHLKDDALASLERALEALGDSGDNAEWWREWIQIKLDQLQVYYYQARTDEIRRTEAELESPMAIHATSLQRARRLRSTVALGMRVSEYTPDGDMIADARRYLAAATAANSYAELGIANFMLGLTLLLAGLNAEGVEHLERAHRMAAGSGDVWLETVATTYLAMAARLRSEVDEVAILAAKLLGLAGNADMQLYVGAARAHLAWVSFRHGAIADARRHAEAAKDIWRVLSDRFPFYWLACVPLIGCEIGEGVTDDLIGNAEEIVSAGQHRLPVDLSTPLRAGIDAWAAGAAGTAAAEFREFGRVAHLGGYL